MDHQTTPTPRGYVIDAINEERAYQDAKYGPKNDQKNSIGDFLTYIHQYWDEAGYQLTQGDRVAALHIMRKIAALGFAAMETHGALTRMQEFGSPLPDANYGPGHETAAPQQQSGPDVTFHGETANMPDDLKNLIRRIVGDLPPAVPAFPSLSLPQRRFTGGGAATGAAPFFSSSTGEPACRSMSWWIWRRSAFSTMR